MVHFPLKTWIVEPTNEFEIKEGPTLNEAKRWHGCAKVTLIGELYWLWLEDREKV